jgi:isopenicillin-N epimerase
MLCQRLSVEPVGAEEMLGSMAAVRLLDAKMSAPASQVPAAAVGEDPLHDRLFLDFSIDVPVYYWPENPRRLLRISAAAYNHPGQYERLIEAMARLHQ